MTQDEVQRRLSGCRAELEELGIRSLEIFGSVARGEAAAGSDVDLLVAFDRPIGCSTSSARSGGWSRSSAAASTWSCGTR